MENKIYIMEHNSDMISVYDPVSNTNTALIENIDFLRGIAVDPLARYV
jgi:YVTN family beta-propeller protein